MGDPLSQVNTMLPIPKNDSTRFNKALLQRAVPGAFHAHYRKWLRYFLDFCRKYPPPDGDSEQIRLFIEKLRSKKQTPQQCSQAAHAISLYFESQKWKNYRQPAPNETKLSKFASPANPSTKVRKTNDVVASTGISAIEKAVVAEPSSSFGVSAGTGLQCIAVSFSACPEQRIWRPARCAPRKKIEIYTRRSFQAGN
jgi:hypothetical protein